MKSENTITLSKLINLLPARYEDVDNVDPNSKNSLGFHYITQQEIGNMEKIGLIETGLPKSYEQIDIFSEGSLIDFTKYPYYGCYLYRYKGSNSYYLVYTEFGGHVPELRCRTIVRNLIINPKST